MDGKYFWKKTEETEIDLMDLLCRLCRQWKQIILCVLLAAAVIGGWGFLQTKSSSDKGSSDAQEKSETELTDEEMNAVQDAVFLAEETTKLETYLEHSILMQIDPYHKNRITILYGIDGTDRSQVQKAAESYLNYLLNGGAVDAVQKMDEWSTDGSYLAELLSAWKKTDEKQVIFQNESEQASILFYVEVVGKDAKMAKKLADAVHDAVCSYAKEVKEICGNHTLSLLQEESTEGMDDSLRIQQQEKHAALTAERASLKAMTDAFNKEQEWLFSQEFADGQKNKTEKEAEEKGTGGISVKWMLLGMIGAAFVYGGIYVCWYLLIDTVKRPGEFRERYTFPFFGSIFISKGEKLQKSIQEQTGQVMNRVRLLCKKQNITRLFMTTDFELCDQERKCLEQIAKQLEEYGIQVFFAENMLNNTAIWDMAADIRAVFIVSKIGKTTHHQIDEEMLFYQENDMNVIGVAALE